MVVVSIEISLFLILGFGHTLKPAIDEYENNSIMSYLRSKQNIFWTFP